MDDGYVIPGLNEDYTLAGAKIMEWLSGCTMALVLQELLFTNTARSMPLIIAIVLITTFSMATARRKFPDEERGLRNVVMLAIGVPPPGIPTPAPLQPYWSGGPVREFAEASYFTQLNLGELFTEEARAERTTS
jgi:hypothetical protein